jgi:hypothetical protein
MEKNLYSRTSNVPFVLVVGMALPFCSACQDDKMVEPHGAFLAGTVVDSLSLAPIESAWVSLGDSVYEPLQDELTDSLGYYVTFTGTPGLHRWVFCGKEGYITQSKEFSTAPAETTIVDFELVRRQPTIQRDRAWLCEIGKIE